ncbi:hypothetical protein [Paenibacillus donghaensis]|uniref:Uncharacterized protein n=1 Tax=Paenibacillus donghaensis TaxID=414771 RepID=A0A2Z2KRZ1_9BACL|nr:hypothetical protein [Paenibacillus donghaensis]ASA21828.1 hypothetical protein B9T62_14220 [Paenibacillus donghaensis]
MKNSILELNQKNEVTGRTYLRWVVHEIHENNQSYNENGISWKEQYVLDNINSAKGMPICVQFIDWDKSEPFGHGMTSVENDGPKFQDSAVVGTAENASIETIEVNGRTIRALVAEGYIYEQRFPNFVTWLKSKMYDNDFPQTSIEICGKKNSGNDVIIYESGCIEKGRVPMIYDYTGDAILGIKPSDESAVLLELNHLHNKNIKEENKLDEEIQKQITELNQQLEAAKTTIEGLTKYKKANEDKTLIAELNSKLVTYTEDEKATVKEKVAAFTSEPSAEGIQTIVSEINSFIVQKVLEKRTNKEEQEQLELNSAKSVYGDMFENNKTKQDYTDIY